MGVVTGFSGYCQWVEAVDVVTGCGHWVVDILFHNEISFLLNMCF